MRITLIDWRATDLIAESFNYLINHSQFIMEMFLLFILCSTHVWKILIKHLILIRYT